jgi:hypothetical protein
MESNAVAHKPKAPYKKELVRIEVKMSGNPWDTSGPVIATVPIPNDVIITKVIGEYTERDRKLWSFLVSAVWDDLLTARIHALRISKIHDVFRRLGGDHSPGWIWESAKRLSKTHVEYERGDDGKRLVGISNLLNAETNEDIRESGVLRFEVPALLSEVIRTPYRFSRLRIHFMLGLSGKYAVTLYMLLESVANLQTPVLDVEINQLRQWLKIPEGKMEKWYDISRFALEPALKQINENPQAAGFSVKVEKIKNGRAVSRLRFIVTKTAQRLEQEDSHEPELPLLEKPQVPQMPAGYKPPLLPLTAYEQAKKFARGWDIYALEQEWREWLATKDNPDPSPASFVAFCKKRGPYR